MDRARRSPTKLIVKVALVAACLLLLLIGVVFYSAKAAEGQAREFCGAISVSSDISTVVEKAIAQGVLYGSGEGYTFYFPSITGFDKATCAVVVDRNGKVVSTRWQMEYD